MATIEIPLNKLGEAIGAEPERQMKEIRKATRMGLLRSIPDLVKKSPFDTGHYASSWQFLENEKSMIIGNFAPHAAIIEYGARPFTPPITPLLEWAKRVLGDGSQPPDYSPRVRSLAYATREKIRLHGMKPRKILEQSIPMILDNIRKEFKKLE